MNRKMRAKLNNQQARARKERKPCPDVDKIFETAQPTCDTCGEELRELKVLALVVEEPTVDKRQLN